MTRTRQLTSRLTYANVMSTIACFLALGGVSYAAITIPRNSVGTHQLRGNAVTSAKIANNTITLRDLATPTRTALKGQRGPAGATGPAGPTGARGPSDLYYSTTSAPTTMTLPPGTYLIFGVAYANDPGTTCTLTAGTPSDTAGLPQGGAMTLIVTATLTTPTTASMSCTGAPTYTTRIFAVETERATSVSH